MWNSRYMLKETCHPRFFLFLNTNKTRWIKLSAKKKKMLKPNAKQSLTMYLVCFCISSISRQTKQHFYGCYATQSSGLEVREQTIKTFLMKIYVEAAGLCTSIRDVQTSLNLIWLHGHIINYLPSTLTHFWFKVRGWHLHWCSPRPVGGITESLWAFLPLIFVSQLELF